MVLPPNEDPHFDAMTPRGIRRGIFVSAVCGALLLSAEVRAAGENETSTAAAESLFQEGRKLVEAKRYSEACPKFAASQKLAPAIGTLLNLADCYEKNGQLASAWVRFHEAIALAQRLGRPNREQTARDRADKLEPRLSKLSISAHPSVRHVSLDGIVLDSAVLETPIPVDSGRHTVEASATGKQTFSTTIEISDKTRSVSVEIPELADESPPKTNASSIPQKTAPTTNETTNEKGEARGAWPLQKTIGLVAASVGVVGLGAGGYFGLRTSSLWEEAQAYCENLICERQGVDLTSQAMTAGNIATVSVIAGSAFVLGGAILFFTAPSAAPSKPGRANVGVGFGPKSIIVGGAFQ